MYEMEAEQQKSCCCFSSSSHSPFFSSNSYSVIISVIMSPTQNTCPFTDCNKARVKWWSLWCVAQQMHWVLNLFLTLVVWSDFAQMRETEMLKTISAGLNLKSFPYVFPDLKDSDLFFIVFFGHCFPLFRWMSFGNPPSFSITHSNTPQLTHKYIS